jgi:virginiamycin A acetyltransferase
MIMQRMLDRLRGRHDGSEEFASSRLRAKYRALGVDIGLYSYGCFDLSRVPAGVSVGRYCSFAPTAQILLRNHGLGFIGLTAYLYNQHLGVVDLDMIPASRLTIGDDVWVGHNATVLAQVKTIGRGAVIAAGAVVTKPVPAYSIVAGNPARILRMRFDDETIRRIEETRWWEMEPAELRVLAASRPELVFDPAGYFSRSGG